tara:strand:+ start:497 stop:805 length:309 start_codon:yes stop_codon:yes gene_type:complete
MTTPDEATSKMRIIDHVEATINKFHGLNSKQIKDKLPAINPDSICPAIDALKKAKTIRGVDSDEGNWAVFYPVPPTINQLTVPWGPLPTPESIEMYNNRAQL